MGLEAQMITGLRRRSPAILQAVYETHKDDLLSLAVFLLRNIAEAEDVLHDVFLRLAERPPRLWLGSNLKAYLATCVANRARDVLRKHSQRKRHELLVPQPVPESSPDASLACQEEICRVRQAMLDLPQEQSQVIAMHVFGQMTFKQIAGNMGERQNTIQSRYRYGMEKLRSILKTEDAS